MIQIQVGLNFFWPVYIDGGPSEEVQNARIISLSTVFTELLPFLIFAIKSLSGATSESIQGN